MARGCLLEVPSTVRSGSIFAAILRFSISGIPSGPSGSCRGNPEAGRGICLSGILGVFSSWARACREASVQLRWYLKGCNWGNLVFAHTESMGPRGRSLSRNPWLLLKSHGTLTSEPERPCEPQRPLCFLAFGLATFLQHYQKGSQEAEPAWERWEGLWHPWLHATESIRALCCSALWLNHCWWQACPVCVTNNGRCHPARRAFFLFPLGLTKISVAYWICELCWSCDLVNDGCASVAWGAFVKSLLQFPGWQYMQ